MKMRCGNCRWWQFEYIDRGHVCVNADSEEVAEFTEESFICPKWEQVLEQDGNATWYFDEK